MIAENIKRLLDEMEKKYNNSDFIALDPISIPKIFHLKQDIEIAAFFAATLAWGQRATILKNLKALMALMDNTPHEFIVSHKESDRKRFLGFVHRTFTDTDLLYFIEFLQHHFTNHTSLESAFTGGMKTDDTNTENALIYFHKTFFSLPHLTRTEKHVSTPLRKSACKRINLFLKWMVRLDDNGVDFGIWKSIKPAQLLCPLDVHVHRMALELGLITRTQANWQTVLELTQVLKQFDASDPVKYDFALFGMGLEKKLT